MTTGSKVCPFCGKLNAADEARCIRCGRPIGGGPPPRARGPVGTAPAHSATTFFIVVSLGVYVALLLGGRGLFQPVNPARALRWGALAGPLGEIEPWRFLSAMFVHFNVLHVGFNTMALHSLGRSLEGALGSARFVLVFLGTGIAGFVASHLWYAPQPLTGGISGGVFGLLGAAVGWHYARGNPEWKRLAWTGVGYAVAMALIPGFQVNNAAHLGGLGSGAVLGWASVRARGPLADRVANGLAFALVAATIGSIALSLASPVAG